MSHNAGKYAKNLEIATADVVVALAE